MQTVKELAGLIAVPESTLRLYRDEFDDLIPCTGQGRKRRYTEDGIAVLRRIVAWKREGWASGRIRDALAREQPPKASVVGRARHQTQAERLDEAILLLTAQAGELALLRTEVVSLRAEIRQLTDALRDTEREPIRYEDVVVARDR